MAKVSSYSFGSYRCEGCSTHHHLEVLLSVLCKVCCVDVPDYDVHKSLSDYFLEYPEAKDIIANLRDLLNISLN